MSGPARIVRTLAEADAVKDGDIIIVKTTGPAWTPLFAKIGGVVMETGGVLCHGAVVAREYSRPGVSNIEGALKVFKDGETLVVDGENGIVYRKA